MSLEDLRRPERAPHGTRARYVAGCRCEDCGAANRTYASRWRARRRALGPIYVDVAPVREHLRALQALGVSPARVGQLVGLSETRVRGLLYERVRLCARRKAELVLAIPLRRDLASPGARVDATRTWRRVEELRAEGMTNRDIAERLGLRWFEPRATKTVLARTARRVRALHRTMTAGA